MITIEESFDIHHRIRAARRSRCGGEEWVPPPASWAAIVSDSWPQVWGQEPSRVPDGWCDLLMAFSEHAIQLAGGGLMHDALENVVTGKLVILSFYDDDRSIRLMDAVRGYQSASMGICRVCGEPGAARQHPTRPTWVLCDDHFEGRASMTGDYDPDDLAALRDLTFEPRIIRNRIRCRRCDDIIESTSQHDFVQCSCGAVFVDGGHSYQRIGGEPEDYENLSEYRDD